MPPDIVLGDSAAERKVLLLSDVPPAQAELDPAVTAKRRVTVFGWCLDSAEDWADPHRKGPLRQWVIDDLLALPTDVAEASAIGLIGVGGACQVAVHVAQSLGATVDRLALVSAPAPADVSKDSAAELLTGVTTKTLLMNGQRDVRAANQDAAWYREHLSQARVEMVPARLLLDGHLELHQVWDRVLSHVAPRTNAR